MPRAILPVAVMPMCFLCSVRRSTFRVSSGGYVCDGCSVDREVCQLIVPRGPR